VIPGTTIPLTPTTLALGGAALAAVAVLLVSIGLGLSAGRTRANTRSRNYYRTLDTVFDRRQQSPATNATKINQPLKPLSQDDEDLLITQVIEDENFKKAMQSSQGAVVGRVRLSLIPPREFELTSAGLTVGRAKDNDIIIPGDKFISRHLLRFVVKPDGVWVERLSKANPVIISGMYMIEAPRKLRSREVIQISPTLNLVFVAREDAAPHSDFDDEVTKL
jgi:pSer/pThr/pTyr-binding forkhead associated (FHA) protein